MKANTRPPLAVLALILLLSTPLANIARAEARSIRLRHDHASMVSREAKGSSSQGNPKKLVDSSFRRIPPSTSNPIGNK
ncbi:Ubiquitin-conjugating enzyme 34 isoform 1 [Hibiscus syriacus]|uniref:Ubiquitin-conjugating enzyme 34 isoform 1 n=1 Tax=Hibiscus syriacus TaxID=106335 RepID=A0A6A2XJ82_HIBSY|nr:Ubiquitin-conjugating enzyme 34 isoform 1 [Hibiscus syriacus]